MFPVTTVRAPRVTTVPSLSPTPLILPPPSAETEMVCRVPPLRPKHLIYLPAVAPLVRLVPPSITNSGPPLTTLLTNGP